MHHVSARAAAVVVAFVIGPVALASTPLPLELSRPASPDDVARVLAEADAAHAWITVEEIGRSAGERPLLAVHLDRSGGVAGWTVLFVGQQHGDEPAGGTALLHLVAAIAADPERLPPDVDLWVVPIANPDGAAAGSRRNGAGADLNRDHLTLSQPETLALHRLARRVRPHVVVDCHEFGRDSADYGDRGWTEWPLIMMDTANLPWLPSAVYDVGLEWVEAARVPMAAAGFSYSRYLVGDAPPDGELRPSTLDADDARNGLALHAGALGFIIESGVFRTAPDPAADLDRRVAAYLTLLEPFLSRRDLRAASLEAVAAARAGAVPAFVPVNALWGNVGPQISTVPVVLRSDGEVVEIATANRMHDRMVKHSVATPKAYWIEAAHAAPYRKLLDRHEIPFEEIGSSRRVAVSACALVRVEEDYDATYHRYGGRQIVTCDAPSVRSMAAGSLRVAVAGFDGRRAVPVLDPRRLYGLYQFEEFLATVADDGQLPVLLE